MKYSLLILTFMVALTSCGRAEESRVLDIQAITSESGIEAWLVEDHSLPIISLRFAFKGAGAINNEAAQQGLVKLLSNTLDEGAGEIKSQDFQKALSDHSISLSFSSSRDHFGGQVKTLTRYQDKAFELLELALTKPRFDAEPLQRMKDANISRLQSSRTDPNWIAARIQNDLIFKGHPYALNSGGTINSLQSLSAEDLRVYKDQYLTKDRLIVAATGDITAEQLKALIDRIFSDLPKGDGAVEEAQSLTSKTGIFYYTKDIPQTVIEMSVPAFDRSDKDYYALQIFNYIFGGGGFGSRLMEEAREKRGLTYGIYSSTYFLNQAQTFSVSTSTEKVDEMIQIIEEEIDKIKTSGVSDEELQKAKDYLIGSLPLSLTSTEKISALLIGMQQNERPLSYLDEYKYNISAVTTSDIKRVANRVLNSDKMTTVLVGRPTVTENMIEIKDIPNVE